MPIKITKAFQWSPNGYDIATVDAGEYESLPDRASQIAVQLGAVEEGAAPPSTSPVVIVPQVPAEGLVQVAGGEQPSGDGAVIVAPTAEATQGTVVAAGVDAPEVKAGRRRNRAAEPANG